MSITLMIVIRFLLSAVTGPWPFSTKQINKRTVFFLRTAVITADIYNYFNVFFLNKTILCIIYIGGFTDA